MSLTVSSIAVSSKLRMQLLNADRIEAVVVNLAGSRDMKALHACS
jgi:hypothetical protein